MATIGQLQNMAADVSAAMAVKESEAARLADQLARVPAPLVLERLTLDQVAGHLAYQRKVLAARLAYLAAEEARVRDGGGSAAPVLTTSAELTEPGPVMPVANRALAP